MPTPDMRKIAFRSNTDVANTAVPITLAAIPGRKWRLVAINASYLGGTPIGGITVTGLLDETIASPGLSDDFDVGMTGEDIHTPDVGGLRSRPGVDLVITLAAGGASAVGRLNVTAIREPENV